MYLLPFTGNCCHRSNTTGSPERHASKYSFSATPHIGRRAILLDHLSVGHYLAPVGLVLGHSQQVQCPPCNHLDRLDCRIAHQETALPLVRIGQPVTLTVDALPGQSFSGKVHAIDPVVDPVSRNVRVRARIANPAGTLKPGMFARATADLGGKTHAILLPEQVIVPKPDGSYVFLAVDGKAELRKVVLGKRDPGRVEIVSGVVEGDTVILDGQIKLRPGVPVVTLDQAAQMMRKQAGKPAAK